MTRRAGPWPRGGTIAEYEAAAALAEREARRTGDIEWRWNTRFRLWEPPQRDDPAVARHAARLAARRHKAIEIAEDRQWLLRRLVGDRPAGAA
jgi:hypothetical protein